jgi:hypothetical protein
MPILKYNANNYMHALKKTPVDTQNRSLNIEHKNEHNITRVFINDTKWCFAILFCFCMLTINIHVLHLCAHTQT